MENLQSTQEVPTCHYVPTEKDQWQLIKGVNIHRKFIPFMEATQAFYLGQPFTGMTDREWDIQRFSFKEEIGQDILHFMTFGQGTDVRHRNLGNANKMIVTGDYVQTVHDYLENLDWYFIGPKYDGCSLVAYYKFGKLERIASQADGVVGKDQTAKFLNMVPHLVPNDVDSIQMEVVISLEEGLGGLTRNKANGLVNSKHMQDEVERLATLRAYRVNFIEGSNQTYSDMIWVLNTLPVLVNESGRVVFCMADKVDRNELPVSDMGDFKSGKFLVDGCAVVCEMGIQIFKHYSTDAPVQVTVCHQWNESALEKWVPTLVFDMVEMQGAEVRRCASGGPQNLIDRKIGVGAVIEIARVGGTIPTIHSTVVESTDFTMPDCPHCKTPLDIKNIFGGGVMCVRKECEGKTQRRIDMTNWMEVFTSMNTKDEFAEFLVNDIHGTVGALLNLSGWNPVKKWNGNDIYETVDQLFTSVNIGDSDSFLIIVKNAWSYSWAQMQCLEINYLGAYNALKTKFDTLT